jgi:hypothetical protein
LLHIARSLPERDTGDAGATRASIDPEVTRRNGLGLGTGDAAPILPSGRSALRRLIIKLRSSNAFVVVRLFIVTSIFEWGRHLPTHRTMPSQGVGSLFQAGWHSDKTRHCRVDPVNRPDVLTGALSGPRKDDRRTCIHNKRDSTTIPNHWVN